MDGKRICIFDHDRLRVFETQSGQLLKEIAVLHRALFTRYADVTSRDGNTLVTPAVDTVKRTQWLTLIDTEAFTVRTTEQRPYEKTPDVAF